MLKQFDSWQEVLDYVEAGHWLWYHAPMDLRANSVRVVRVFKNGKLRLDPGAGADPFTADRGHLPRMRRYVR